VTADTAFVAIAFLILTASDGRETLGGELTREAGGVASERIATISDQRGRNLYHTQVRNRRAAELKRLVEALGIASPSRGRR
jgi:hypothetical protein